MATHSNKMVVTPHPTTRHVTSTRVRGSQHVPSVFASATTMARPGVMVPALAAEAAEVVEADLEAEVEVEVQRSLSVRIQLILEEADYSLVIRVTDLVHRKSWLF